MNTLLAFATGVVVWLLVFIIFSKFHLYAPPPFVPVIIFALIMGAISFVLDIDFILDFFEKLWRVIGQIVSKII